MTDSRTFHLSSQTRIKVSHNVSSLSYGVIISKQRVHQDILKQVNLTIKEWRTFTKVMPSLVETAINMHRDILTGKTKGAVRELRHVISSRFMVLLLIYRSPSEGPSVVTQICPYEQREDVHLACIQRGVPLAFDELLGLSEMLPTLGKYLAAQLSMTKIVTLAEQNDVLAVQSFIQTFFEDGGARVRIMLEKPQQQQQQQQRRRQHQEEEEEEEEEEKEEDAVMSAASSSSSSPSLMTATNSLVLDNGENNLGAASATMVSLATAKEVATASPTTPSSPTLSLKTMPGSCNSVNDEG